MTAPRDRDARIAAFFAANQPDLPDRTFDAVHRDIHRTRQLIVVGPFREPDSVLGGRFVAAAVVVLAVGIALLNLRPVVGPGAVPMPTATPTVVPSPSVSPSVAASASGPSVFTSPLYGYTVPVPAGWISGPATLRWDGTKQPGPDAETDKFVGPERLTAWAIAGPFSGDLAAFVEDRIVATARDHSDTCPVREPSINEPLQIGGQAWVLLGWNCGALINTAVTVRAGVAYAFTFRDLAVIAASDPDDRALFLSMLRSIELPT
ncbi:MAG TPA: hypothetical protein VFP66_02655 [Candidatus Limnocylindrales bacterium]|nr:hypothetical protein [Candidatus Limnocylindrales bacterium]